MDQDKPDTSEADFEAGFTGDATPTETPETPPAETPPQEPAAPEYVQLTKAELESLHAQLKQIDELKSSLEKLSGLAMGKIGGIERWKSEQQAAAEEARKLRDSVSQSQIDVLQNEFPEHSAVLNLMRNIPAIPVATTVDPKAVEEAVKQNVAPIREEMQRVLQIERLTDLHPDWAEVTSKDNAQWQAYVKTLPEAEQQKLDQTWDARYVAGHITKFKTPPKPKQETPAAPTVDLAQRRASRIAAAVTPRGSGTAPASDPQDDFASGFVQRKV